MTKCVLCGVGNLHSRRVDLLRKQEDKIYLFKEVPARICDQCGERYFASRVVAKMDGIMRSDSEGAGKVEATVFIYPREKEAA